MNKTKKRLTLTERKIINAAVIVVAILIIVGLPLLTQVLVNRFPQIERDITAKGAYTLDDATAEYLNYLDAKVDVTVLMPEENFVNLADDTGSPAYYYQANELLEKMSVYDSFNLSYKDISTTSQSVLENKYPDADWTSSDNIIVVEYGDKYEVLTMTDVFSFDPTSMMYYNSKVITSQNVEQEVLRAIQKLVTGESFKVAVSIGNGEFLNEASSAYADFNAILSLLEFNAYEIQNINLLTEELTDEIDALIMMAPMVDITDEQSEKINNWLTNGGNYGKTFMYVPYDYADGTENMDLLLEQWGMKVTKGYVLEKDETMTPSVNDPVGYAEYANETFTEDIRTSLYVMMPYSMGVEITDAEIASPLLTTTDKAEIAVLGTENGETIKAEEAVNYAAIGTKGNSDKTETSNIIVWGSYDSLRYDRLLTTNFNNATYVLNMFNTALGNDSEGIVIDSVDLATETISVTAGQQKTVLVIFVFVLPLAVAALGVVIWVRRKNK